MSINLPMSIFVVDSHTAGEPTRLVVGGLPKLRGNSIAAKRDYIKSEMDYIRHFLCDEPRGHYGMFGAILTEATKNEADFGVIYFSHEGYHDMCGHAAMGIAAVLIESNMVHVEEPVTKITLEAPCGVVQVKAQVIGGKVKSVSLINVPSFLYKAGVSVNVPEYGDVKGDIAFGGNWKFYINAVDIAQRVRPENIDALLNAGRAIKNQLNKEFELFHATNPDISTAIDSVYFIDSPVKNEDADEKNVVVSGRLFDRSPCGAGTCGRIAILAAKNKLGLNEDFVNEGITGTIFRGRFIERTQVGEYPAVIPEVTGNAYITGFNHYVLDPDDPFGAKGFCIGEEI